RKSIFYPSSRKRCFKWIKPKDAFNTVVCVYHLTEAACLLLLITDSYPNSIYAEFFCYLSRLIGYSLAVTVPISLIYSTPESQLYAINSRWKPNARLNIFAFWLIITPFITNVPFSLLTGYYADKNEVLIASRMLMLNSIAWCLWTLQFVVILLYAYYNLVFNMRGYVDQMRRRNADELRIQELQITRKIVRPSLFNDIICFLSNQTSAEQTYVIQSLEMNQMTTQKTNDHENARTPKSHRIDKRRDSIAEAFKHFISSSNNEPTCLVSVGGTTIVSGQFGLTDQTEIHEPADSINWQDTRSDNSLQYNGSNSIMRAWLIEKPLRCDLDNKNEKSDSRKICNNNL
ncbi:14680_t:CDS:2, partial [Dentiscutata erythropus]